mgnify:CR=1 FL=1
MHICKYFRTFVRFISMPKSIHVILFAFLSVLTILFSGCNPCRYVPSDKYLLNKAKIKIEDRKDVSASELNGYLRQKQNTEIFGFWKLQLHIYNTAPKDTLTKSQKRLTRNAHKMGEEPVIYDPIATGSSMEQLKKAMANKGFFNAKVDTSIVYKVKRYRKKEVRRANVTYCVTANEPYIIRDYTANISNDVVRRIANSAGRMVQNGDRFNSSVLDNERQRIASGMRRQGYYYFDKSMLEYRADSSYSTNEVAMEIKLQDYLNYLPDSIKDRLYSQYHIANVYFHQDYDPKHLPEDAQIITDEKNSTDGYVFTYVNKRLLRDNVLRKACRIVPGMLFDEAAVEATYANLNSLGPIKYIDVAFVPVGKHELDCHVTLSRNKLNNVSAELEGTYSAGDWGIAAGVGYVNKNIFRGAEQLSLNGRASYEWRQAGGRAIEGTAEAGLLFPNSLKINIAYKYQHRPDEYTRTIANAGLYYTARKNKKDSHWTHQFNLLDISYVYLPYVSDTFRINFLEKSTVLKYSYEDHFIVGWSYQGKYNGFNSLHPYRSYITFNYALETAGNLLFGISTLAHQKTNEVGQYEFFKIPYSQYAKADMNFSFHHILAPKHQLVSHIGLGVAVPYLNSSVVPFEKRYFSGGSSSVRGWQARSLGPGAFSAQGSSSLIYEKKAGDIRLDVNLEYRYHVLKFLELAAFFDAGNIWTIRDYEEQPGGVFRWNEFYKQIALAYGIGVRLDFSVLIFRIDFGVKLYDPSRINGVYAGTQWRTAKNGLGWNDDMTFHFAIGYPF